ncbi:MAG: cytochrome c oxidase subunit II [Chloroflexi bacterium]|nr:cytochrome c oxidase subunit II [Chloroflexota bacterium]
MRRLPTVRGCLLVTFAAGALLHGCAGAPSTLDPQGPVAARIADLWWLMASLGTAVYLTVMAVLLWTTLRPHQQTADEPASHGPGSAAADRNEVALIVVGGIAVPAIILFFLMVSNIRTIVALAAPGSKGESASDLTVTVIGRQFWWEVRYPGAAFVTANEIRVPVGRPVRLELTSTDVIHSFWVPQLMGKLDMIPGQTTSTWLQADRPGVYRGQCAEYCGVQHAHMAFLVVAEPPDQFAAWVDRQRQPAVEPTDPFLLKGVQAFSREGCIQCHAIRIGGSAVGGTLGPDLTHVGGRLTIGAGLLENTYGNRAGWIGNPQALKPGNKMPTIPMDPESLRALAAYLGTLQ